MIGVALAFLFLPAAIVGGIIGIVKIVKTPQPPAGSSRTDIERWYNGGWKEAQRLEELERLIEEDKKRVNEDVREYLKSGEQMEAIKRYKDYYECSISEAKTAIAEIEWELEYERYRAEKDATDGLVDVQTPVSLDTMPNEEAVDAHDAKRKEADKDVNDKRVRLIICGLIIYGILSCCGVVVAILVSCGLISVS